MKSLDNILPQLTREVKPFTRKNKRKDERNDAILQAVLPAETRDVRAAGNAGGHQQGNGQMQIDRLRHIQRKTGVHRQGLLGNHEDASDRSGRDGGILSGRRKSK